MGKSASRILRKIAAPAIDFANLKSTKEGFVKNFTVSCCNRWEMDEVGSVLEGTAGPLVSRSAGRFFSAEASLTAILRPTSDRAALHLQFFGQVFLHLCCGFKGHRIQVSEQFRQKSDGVFPDGPC